MLTKQVAQLLAGEKVPYQLLSHVRAYTAQGTAASLHVSGREFAKCVLVRARDGRRALAVVPAARHLDLDALGGLLGSDVELMPEETAVKLFPDCEPGAEPPFCFVSQIARVLLVQIADRDKLDMILPCPGELAQAG